MQYKHLLVFRHEPQNELGRKKMKMQLQQGREDQMKGSLVLPTHFTNEVSQIYTYFTSTYFFCNSLQSKLNKMASRLELLFILGNDLIPD